MSYNKLKKSKNEKSRRVIRLYTDGFSFHIRSLKQDDIALETYLFDVCGLMFSLASYLRASHTIKYHLSKADYLTLIKIPHQLEKCKTKDEAFKMTHQYCELVEGING